MAGIPPIKMRSRWGRFMALMALGWRQTSQCTKLLEASDTLKEGPLLPPEDLKQAKPWTYPGHIFPLKTWSKWVLKMGYTSKWPLKIGKMMNKSIGFGVSQFLDNPNDPKKNGSVWYRKHMKWIETLHRKKSYCRFAVFHMDPAKVSPSNMDSMSSFPCRSANICRAPWPNSAHQQPWSLTRRFTTLPWSFQSVNFQWS